MIQQIKNYLNIDSDIKEHDDVLDFLHKSAIAHLQVVTGKMYDPSSELMKLFIMLYVKILFEGRTENTLQQALKDLEHTIKMATEFMNIYKDTDNGGSGEA